MYKFMSYELRDREEHAAYQFYHAQDIPPEVKAYREPVDIERLLDGVTLAKLYSVFRDIVRRQENRVDPIRSRFGNLKKEEVDMGETMRFVEQYIVEKKHCMFHELLTLRKGKQYMIVTFLTLLQLMKDGKVEVEQPETFADIAICYTGKEGGTTELSQDYD